MLWFYVITLCGEYIHWSQATLLHAGSFLHEMTLLGFWLITSTILSISSRAAVPGAHPVTSWIREKCTQHESRISDSCKVVAWELSFKRSRHAKNRSLVAPRAGLPPWLCLKQMIDSKTQSKHVSSLASRTAASLRFSAGSTSPVGNFHIPPFTAAGPVRSFTRRIHPSVLAMTHPTPT